MTFGSLFAGAGGFDLGFDRVGMECRWQVEIDPTACDVLARHWPNVPKREDVRDSGKKNLAKVDVICGGFPCQDLSVAGKRGGMVEGNRSGLFYELARIVRELRPRFLVWENVPGLLSSDDGRDFARVLRQLGDIGYFGACRVLDSRFFGVPQRRRRVFGVFARGRFGAERSAEILALTQGVQRDSAKGREAGERIAFSLTASVGRSSEGNRIGNAWNTNYVPELSPALKARDSKGPSSDGDGDGAPLVAHSLTANGFDASEDGTGRGTPLVAVSSGRGYWREGEDAGTLGTEARAVHENNLVAFTGKDHGADAGELAPTLRAMGHDGSHANGGGRVAVAFAQNQRDELREMEIAGAVAAEPGMKQQTYLRNSAGVRRLTPRECERLMSWPDDHTRYRADGREIADGPRYRLCGNGVVANVAEWIGRQLIDRLSEQGASHA